MAKISANNTSDSDDEILRLEKEISANTREPRFFNQLMIAYRKQKRYGDEVRIIRKAITTFEKHLAAAQQHLRKGAKAATIRALSEKISRQTGLVDKKGEAVHVPEPIAGWQKRLAVAEKKLAAVKAKK